MSAETTTMDDATKRLIVTIAQIVVGAETALDERGVPGRFTIVPHERIVMLDWNGARRCRGEAERALLAALTAAGMKADVTASLGVRVFRDPPAETRDDAIHLAA